MLKQLSLLLVLGSLLAGCAARYNRQMTDLMSPWVGKPISSVIQQWGPPNTAYDDEAGKNYVWHRQQTITLPGQTSSRPNYNTGRYHVEPGQTITRKEYRLFVVNKDGVIAAYKFGTQK